MKRLLTLVAVILALGACQDEITLELPEPDDAIVVEGSIENDSIAVVILTRNDPYFSSFNFNDLGDYFVTDAEVRVTDGIDTVQLTELSVPSTAGFDFIVYADLAYDMIGEMGKTYWLLVQAGDTELKAQTTIPNMQQIDSLYYRPVTEDNDTLVALRATVKDPDTLGNYYRSFTRVNSDLFWPPLNSVADDLFINGVSFDFPIFRGQPRTEELDPNTYGFFTRGDTVRVKFCAVDARHYDFWATIEQQLGQEGSPFASPTEILSNVEGGLGVWGGYGAVYRTIIIGD